MPPCRCQQRNSQHGTDYVYEKRDACVAGREIARREHLMDVADGIAYQKDRRRPDRCRLEREAAPERRECSRSDSQVRHTDLKLERTDLPADIRRRDGREKEMEHGGP